MEFEDWLIVVFSYVLFDSFCLSQWTIMNQVFFSFVLFKKLDKIYSQYITVINRVFIIDLFFAGILFSFIYFCCCCCCCFVSLVLEFWFQFGCCVVLSCSLFYCKMIIFKKTFLLIYSMTTTTMTTIMVKLQIHFDGFHSLEP